MSRLNRKEFEDLIEEFSTGFNEADLDSVMEYFGEDALYEEFNGVVRNGKPQIRLALEPQFDAAFGKITFESIDKFVDEAAQKALYRWWCIMENEGKILRCQGVDLFKLENGKIIEKRTFMHGDMPGFADV